MHSFLVMHKENGEDVLIQDSFNWIAFFFAPLWLLYHKLFTTFVFYLSVQIIFNFLQNKYGGIFSIIPSFVIAIFATDLLKLKNIISGAKHISTIRALDYEHGQQKIINICR